MPTLTLLQIDAFTNEPFCGNACAVVLDASELSDETMLRIARELNKAETAFVRTSTSSSAEVRFFSPAEEIFSRGYPSVAAVFALVQLGRINLTGACTMVSLQLREGVIDVAIHAHKGAQLLVEMFHKDPVFMRIYEPSEVLDLFGLRKDDVLSGVPIQTVSAGTPHLMVPLRNVEALRRAKLNVEPYQGLRDSGDFVSPHLFCLQGVTEKGRTFSRHFGVPPNLPEDPFTGSATGDMAAYMWRYNLIESPTFIAEQGHWLNRPGTAFVEVIGRRDDISMIKIGGYAVTVSRGQLSL